MKQVLWMALLLLIGSFTAAFQLDRQSRYQPELAQSVPAPARYFAQAHVAVEALNGEDPEAALAATETLLKRRPIPAEHMRLNAQALFKAGDAESGLRGLQVAARRGWRDPVTQQAMAQIAWAAGDGAASANRLAALYAREADDPVLEALAEDVLSDPSGRDQMAALLAGPARWEARFVRQARHDLSHATFNAVLLEAHSQGARFTCGPLRDAVSRQARDQPVPEGDSTLAPLIESNC